ncbi:MAG: PKD domain-containing protein [Marinifilum sp.]|jgi:hypothetical protein|nr:PKD domain-containing protein [Marinifilum sp.]
MVLKLLRTGLIIGLLILSCAVHAQISFGGKPIFKGGGAKAQLNPQELPKMDFLSKSSVNNEKLIGVKLKHAQYAYSIDVNYSISENGVWEELADGRKVWRFSLKSEGAYSLGLIFSKFKLPKGAKLFVYNNSTEQVLGSYTHKNNKLSGKFSVEPLEGDELTIEYIELPGAEFSAELEIESVLHDYKNVFNLLKGAKSEVKASGSCNVDINCSEGDDWQTEKRSVCSISYVVNNTGFIASGALINNTNQDGTPYLLTAFHVIHDQEVADNAIFYFNYENSACNSNDGQRSQSVSGATIRATTSNLDFTLLELTVAPPASYMPYYAGWDHSGRIPAYTTCIHHPNGDAKKISVDNDSPVTATYSDARYTFDDNSSWQILDWEIGTTEGGSSGSPLFDENHRIIGDLTGGDASCSNSVDDFYAKFSESWANYPNNNQQLKYWLDPLKLGVETLNGLDPYFEISANSRCVGNEFTVELNVAEAVNITWDFGEDATPGQAIGSGPHNVSYNSVGNKTIQLTYTVDGYNANLSRDVRAIDLTKLSFDYTIQKKKLGLINQSVDFDSFTWNFGDGNTSDEVSPNHEYLTYGNYTVSLTGENDCGSTSTTKKIEMNYDKLLSIYPNPSADKFTIDLSKIVYSKIVWSVYSSTGAKVKNGIISEFSNVLEFNLKGLAAGVYILQMDVDGEILQQKIMLVK